MAAVPEDIKSPVIANLVVILGFVAIFSTFATESPFSWIIGLALILSGGIWAGAHSAGGGPSDGSTA